MFCALAKLSRTPVIIVGVGADLLERSASKFFAKWSVRLADYTSFRSLESHARIRALGVMKDAYVSPDPAHHQCSALFRAGLSSGAGCSDTPIH